jgi:hypothetical protein
MGKSGKAIGVILATLFLCVVVAAPAAANFILWVENAGTPVWGDGLGGFVEPMMSYRPLFGPSCSFNDLDPDNPFIGRGPRYGGPWFRDFYSTHFWVELWLANNFNPVTPRRVDVELWSSGVLKGTASQMVTNAAPAQKYVFDFGVIDLFAETNMIEIKIVYYGPLGDTHVYWASDACASGLYSDAPLPADHSTWGGIKALYR